MPAPSPLKRIPRAVDTPSKRVIQVVDGQKLILSDDTRLAFCDIVGEESMNGKLISAGPILNRIDGFAASLGENVSVDQAIVTISVDRVDIKNPIAHGDLVRLEGEVITIGRSSLVVQISGYRQDIESAQFIEALSAFVTMVAVDPKTLRPRPGLPKLVNPNKPGSVEKLEAMAKQRKELGARWRAVQEEVDQLPFVSADMIKDFGHEHSPLIPIPETQIEIQNSFLPKHLNRNNTIFGGDLLMFMDKVALQCAKSFTKNKNMFTVSMNRIFFKLPVNMTDIVTMHARVCSVRRHHLEVEVDVFIAQVGTKDRKKSNTGYFTIVNLDRSYRKERIAKGLQVDERDQPSMRTMLKAQHRWTFDTEDMKLLALQPLQLTTTASHSVRTPTLQSQL